MSQSVVAPNPSHLSLITAAAGPQAPALRYFPAFLDLRGREALVVGGGVVAARKVRLLQGAGANVTVVAKRPAAELFARAAQGAIGLVTRGFVAGDLRGKAIAVAATDCAETNARVAEAARIAGVPVNVVDDAASSTFIVPAIVERGDVVVAISTSGAAPVLAQRLRAQIEAALPLRLGRLAAFARRVRSEVRRRLPDSLARRRLWETVLEGAVADAVLSGDEDRAEAALAAALAGDRPQGSVAIVGAGPGDPELLTLKALRLIQSADVIVYDKLVDPGTLSFARRDAELIYAGKSRGHHTLPQSEINALLAHHARQGRRVVRLKGGDPFIFGRGGEEVEHLVRQGIDFETVPGVTAASACAAAAIVPLTHRGSAEAVVLVTGQGSEGEPDIDWSALARLDQTIAVYMGVGAAARIESALVAGGLDGATPVAVVENASLPTQRVLHGRLSGLGELIATNGIGGPAVILIGRVAALPASLAAAAAPAAAAALAG